MGGAHKISHESLSQTTTFDLPADHGATAVPRHFIGMGRSQQEIQDFVTGRWRRPGGTVGIMLLSTKRSLG